MAVARLVCGSCGGKLSADDAHCPACGETVELPRARASSRMVTCPACGHANRAGVQQCESCGAPVGGIPGGEPGVGRASGGTAPASPPRTKSGAPAPAGGKQRRFEPWQIVSGIALIALVVVLAYNELSREQPKPTGGTAQPAEVPPQPPVATRDLSAEEAAVAANPKDPDALLVLANGLHDTGRWQRAIDTYSRYLTIVPNNPDARVDMGICYFELSRTDTARPMELYRKAIQEMETAIRKSPKHQPAAFNLGIVHLSMGDIKESNRWFQRAVELNKDSDLGLRAQRILQQHATVQKQ